MEAQGERSQKKQRESEDEGKREEGEMRSEPQKGGGDEFKLQAAMMQGMVKLMEGMQTMQAQILDVKRQKDVEIIKSAVVDLPKLQEWKADTAPLDLADWLLVVEPGLSDLSDNSQQWWEEMLASVKQWYAEQSRQEPIGEGSTTSRRFPFHFKIHVFSAGGSSDLSRSCYWSLSMVEMA